jgi:small GTP-binding protein
MNYAIAVFGAVGVGKSSLVTQFLAHIFPDPPMDPTVEDSLRKQSVIDEESCLLEILDTAIASEDMEALFDQYMRSCGGFLLVYSITSEESFRKIQEMHERILRVKDVEKCNCVLVGNKSDLEEDRMVSTQAGQELAQKFKCPFFEASAKNRVNVEEAFFDCVREMRKTREIRGVKMRARSSGCLVN